MIVIAATAVNFVLLAIVTGSKSYYPYFFLFLFSYCIFFLCGLAKEKAWYPYVDGKNPYWPLGSNSFVAAVAAVALLQLFDLSKPLEIVLAAIAIVVVVVYLIIGLRRKWISSSWPMLFKTSK